MQNEELVFPDESIAIETDATVEPIESLADRFEITDSDAFTNKASQELLPNRLRQSVPNESDANEHDHDTNTATTREEATPNKTIDDKDKSEQSKASIVDEATPKKNNGNDYIMSHTDNSAPDFVIPTPFKRILFWPDTQMKNAGSSSTTKAVKRVKVRYLYLKLNGIN